MILDEDAGYLPEPGIPHLEKDRKVSSMDFN